MDSERRGTTSKAVTTSCDCCRGRMPFESSYGHAQVLAHAMPKARARVMRTHTGVHDRALSIPCTQSWSGWLVGWLINFGCVCVCACVIRGRGGGGGKKR
jgi:hypothetical protein